MKKGGINQNNFLRWVNFYIAGKLIPTLLLKREGLAKYYDLFFNALTI
jgi:hypothetical protein